MVEDDANHDPEKHGSGHPRNPAAIGRFEQQHALDHESSQVHITPFVGRLGGNGAQSLLRDAANEDLLKDIPDAAPLMTLSQQFDPRPFRTVALWKSALMEGMGQF